MNSSLCARTNSYLAYHANRCPRVRICCSLSGAKMALENLSKKKNTAEKIKETEAALMARRRQEKQQSSMAIYNLYQVYTFPYTYVRS